LKKALNEVKPKTDFPVDPLKKEGCRGICKKCRNDRMAEINLKNAGKFQCKRCLQTFTRNANYVSHTKANKCISVEEKEKLDKINRTCVICKKELPSLEAIIEHRSNGECSGVSKYTGTGPHKICTKCNIDLPIDSFGFHDKTLNKRKERCKKCLYILSVQRRELKKDDPLYNKKICSQCNEPKY
jgi:hypothetical protein